LLHGAFSVVDPTGGDGAANKIILFRGQLYFHKRYPAFSRRAASTAA